MKPKRSKWVKKSHRSDELILQVACCECKRGGNGKQDCACGHKSKRWDKQSCFIGELLDKYDVP
jgi:hypothetical protein